MKLKPLDSVPDMAGIEEELRMKRQQIKKRKEELGRIEDDG